MSWRTVWLWLERDLSEYITAENLAPFPFEFRPKAKSINLRISAELLHEIQAEAHRQGIPYQRFIRQVLEASLHRQEISRPQQPPGPAGSG